MEICEGCDEETNGYICTNCERCNQCCSCEEGDNPGPVQDEVE